MAKLSEEQIEARVCRVMDALDYRYLHSPMTEAEYKAEVAALDRWATGAYDQARQRQPRVFREGV